METTLWPEAERKRHAQAIAAKLGKVYAGSQTALHFRNPFELLIATILSAQCTDDRVNRVTPVLFAAYPDAPSLARAPLEKVEQIVQTTGFFRQKAKSIVACSQALAERHGGTVPETMEELTALPGVGRKTANVVRACAMGYPGLIVDTHFKRLVQRMGLTDLSDPDKIEAEIGRLLPEKNWTAFSNSLIWHGRKVCPARKPACADCPVRTDCAYGQGSGA